MVLGVPDLREQAGCRFMDYEVRFSAAHTDRNMREG
jgi:hypothetical protein